MKLELIRSHYTVQTVNFFLKLPFFSSYSKPLKQKYNFWDQKLSIFLKNSYFFMVFRRNDLCFKVILAFCLMQVFAIEHTLQENLVRTGEFRRKNVPKERTVCWQR